jgi:hypothetical protein
MIGLLAALKTALENDAALSVYNEVVSVRKYRPDSLPAFETYGIVLSPASLGWEDVGIRCREDLPRVDLHCLVFDFDAEKSLVGVAAGEVGILQMVEDVIACLEFNSLSDYVEVTGQEVNTEIQLNEVPSSNRDGFYHEVKIRLNYRLLARTIS